MEEVSGSKGVAGDEFGVFAGAGMFFGLKETMQPTSVGKMSVGMAQCNRTVQKAELWNTLKGGYVRANENPESPLDERGIYRG